ncbi:TPA_asm: P [Phellodendron betacytorhabdovirus 1]|nr:TPA_asm: P [Phellodendron betacytorhabdovirus 1]
MHLREIVGKGKKTKLNSFFNNNTAALFLKDPNNLTDDQLPIVKGYSGLSRNQRRKYKNWAFDPKLIRQRMEAARVQLSEKLADSELQDKRSMLEGIIESLSGDPIPVAQTHFKIPSEFEARVEAEMKAMKSPVPTSRVIKEEGPVSTKAKWGDIAEEYEKQQIEDLEKEQAEKIKEDSKKELKKAESFNTNSSNESVNSENTDKSGNSSSYNRNVIKNFRRQQGHVPRGGFRVQYKNRSSHSPRGHKTTGRLYDQDFESIRNMIIEMFIRFNINLNREMEDDLIYMYNTKEYMTPDMVEMYIRGVIKERQCSMVQRQEIMIDKLAHTAASFGRTLEGMKSQVGVMDQMNQYNMSTRRESTPIQMQSQQRFNPFHHPPQRTSGIINPAPIHLAPRKGQAEQYKQQREQERIRQQPPLLTKVEKEYKKVIAPKVEEKSSQIPKSIEIKPLSEEKVEHKKIEDKPESSKVSVNYDDVDLAELIMAALTNVCAPRSLKNAEMMIELNEILGRETWIAMVKEDNLAAKIKYVEFLAEMAADIDSKN